LVWIADGATAGLYQWQGGNWVLAQPLGAAHFQTDGGLRSDVLLPFDWLGLDAGSPLNLVAVATEEGALQLWAAAPGQNPLNSPRLLGAARAQVLDDFQLTQFYQLDDLSNGVRPDGGQVIGSDLRATLSSESSSI